MIHYKILTTIAILAFVGTLIFTTKPQAEWEKTAAGFCILTLILCGTIAAISAVWGL